MTWLVYRISRSFSHDRFDHASTAQHLRNHSNHSICRAGEARRADCDKSASESHGFANPGHASGRGRYRPGARRRLGNGEHRSQALDLGRAARSWSGSVMHCHLARRASHRTGERSHDERSAGPNSSRMSAKHASCTTWRSVGISGSVRIKFAGPLGRSRISASC